MSSAKIMQALQSLNPVSLTVEDDSQAHADHPGRGNGGHYRVAIVSPDFEGKTPVQRHQMVYKALGNLMKSDIHAIQIDAKIP